jgi:hypothetical protein
MAIRISLALLLAGALACQGADDRDPPAEPAEPAATSAATAPAPTAAPAMPSPAGSSTTTAPTPPAAAPGNPQATATQPAATAPTTTAKKKAPEEAKQAGVVGTITGTGDFSSGLDDRTVLGGRLGDQPGEETGGFGFGKSDVGPGGGTGWGTIGTGRYGTLGHGAGTGSGYGTGNGKGGLAGHGAVQPQLRMGNITARGDLDRNLIRRYLRRQLPKLTYCYEKQLLVNHDLQGTVTAGFLIEASGAVAGAKASGVSSEVSSCMADVLASIMFPKPTGGGAVQVSLAFTMRPSGG